MDLILDPELHWTLSSLKSREDTGLLGKGAKWAADQAAQAKDLVYHPPPKGVEPSPDVAKVLIHFQMTGKDTKILPPGFANRPLSRLMFTTDSGTSWSCKKRDGAGPTSKCKALTYPEPTVNLLDDLGKSLNFSGSSFSHLSNEVVELHDP